MGNQNNSKKTGFFVINLANQQENTVIEAPEGWELKGDEAVAVTPDGKVLLAIEKKN